jgi:uncharacterized protein with HEPN domain
MSLRDDDTLLRDMLEAGRAATASVVGADLSLLAFDRIRLLGLVKCIEIIGEAAGRLSRDFRERHSNIPWRDIIGMHNRLVHAYFEIDCEQVWITLTEDLPRLLDEIETILDKGK